MTNQSNTMSAVEFGENYLTIEQVVSLAEQKNQASLASTSAFLERMRKGPAFLERLLKEEGEIYGVTTGYGDSCTVAVPYPLYEELPYHLVRFHGCGMGQVLDPVKARAVLCARLASLAQGFSGVRLVLLQQLVDCINAGIVPRIPEEGSVGASGDLTPLSYVASMLLGEREVWFDGDIVSTAVAFSNLGLAPIDLRPKEALAIMNGTAVMTGLACLAFKRAEYLAQLATRISALNVIALKGNDYHFDARLFAVKPHPGQNQIAGWLRQDLHSTEAPSHSKRLQDRYSLRCAPHVIGVLQDALPMFRSFIENELNSANDNPIIDGEEERILHGGHFYGGHIAFAMDSLKNCVANIADLLDRQMALLMDPKFNHGLPANLSGVVGPRAVINHGFKAVQIGVSAWTAEALKLTMPASVFSRSTECHNQDKVSMGTIAARDCLRILELTEQVAAAVLLAATQGIELRLRSGEIEPRELSTSVSSMQQTVQASCGFIEEDRPLEFTLRQLMAKIQHREWELYEQ